MGHDLVMLVKKSKTPTKRSDIAATVLMILNKYKSVITTAIVKRIILSVDPTFFLILKI
jgi:hypothetical protein